MLGVISRVRQESWGPYDQNILFTYTKMFKIKYILLKFFDQVV